MKKHLLKYITEYKKVRMNNSNDKLCNWCSYKVQGFQDSIYYMDDWRKEKSFMVRKPDNYEIVSHLPDIKDYSTSTEEEIFQESLILDIDIPLELIVRIQQWNNKNFHLGNKSTNKTLEFYL